MDNSFDVASTQDTIRFIVTKFGIEGAEHHLKEILEPYKDLKKNFLTTLYCMYGFGKKI